MKKALSACLGLLIVASAGAWARDEAPADVVSLLQKRCAGCHKGKTPAGGLRWETGRIAEAIDRPSAGMPGLKIIDTASPESSYILKKIRREAGIKGKPMPPLKALEAGELEILEAWILSLKRFPVPASAPGSPDGALLPGAAAGPAQADPGPGFDKPAFWGTLLLNLPTTTTPSKGDFLLRISHSFSDRVEEGFDDLFGLDSFANILFGLGYGITDNLTVTVGRARVYKEFEFGADWLIAEQGRTAGLPFSATLHGGISLATDPDPLLPDSPTEAKFFVAASLSRQLTRRLSVLVVPAFATNTDHWALDPGNTLSLGVGARYMVLNEFSIIAEWIPVLAGYKALESGWGLGIEKKIGGHVFQVFVNNTLGLTKAQFLPGGDLRIGDFDFRLGFNIFRTF